MLSAWNYCDWTEGPLYTEICLLQTVYKCQRQSKLWRGWGRLAKVALSISLPKTNGASVFCVLSPSPPPSPPQPPRQCLAHRVLIIPPPPKAQRRQVEIIWTGKIPHCTPLLPTGIGWDITKPYHIYVKQRSCADVNSPYKPKCWTDTVVPLVYIYHY